MPASSIYMVASSCGSSVPAQYPLNRSRRDAMAFGDPAQTLTLAAVTVDGFVIQC